jgi:hypothetical protein
MTEKPRRTRTAQGPNRIYCEVRLFRRLPKPHKKLKVTIQHQKQNTMKQVSFSELTIAEYPMILGDHPSCSVGPPLQLDWNPQTITTRNLELYEYCRSERRQRKQLAIPVQKRTHLLLKGGYSLEEIAESALTVASVKSHRRETIANQGWDRFNIIMETTGKLPKGIMNGVIETTGGTFKRAKSIKNGFKLMVKPIQNTVQARSA